jgi:hypothetical protein
MKYTAKYLTFLLFSYKEQKFKEGVISDLDQLLFKLNDEDNTYSLVHFETYDTRVSARNRALKIRQMKYNQKIEEFILAKI